MFSMHSLAFAHPPQRSRGRPDSASNVKKADLLRRAVERMNSLGVGCNRTVHPFFAKYASASAELRVVLFF
jgi:hypothetical protein